MPALRAVACAGARGFFPIWGASRRLTLIGFIVGVVGSPKNDMAIDRQGVEDNIDALLIAVRPCGADGNPYILRAVLLGFADSESTIGGRRAHFFVLPYGFIRLMLIYERVAK